MNSCITEEDLSSSSAAAIPVLAFHATPGFAAHRTTARGDAWRPPGRQLLPGADSAAASSQQPAASGFRWLLILIIRLGAAPGRARSHYKYRSIGPVHFVLATATPPTKPQALTTPACSSITGRLLFLLAEARRAAEFRGVCSGGATMSYGGSSSGPCLSQQPIPCSVCLAPWRCMVDWWLLAA